MSQKAAALSEAEIQDRLKVHPEWQVDSGVLTRTFTFADFVAAMQFVNAVAEVAQDADHHPDIDIRYNKVTLGLVTHESGGITEKDFSLAAEANLRAE